MFKKVYLFTLAVLTGCCRISSDPSCALQEVEEEICERSGEAIFRQEGNPCWMEEKLQSPLDLDTAVQITLLNNPRMQALYCELGVSQAELMQASLFKNPIFSFSARYENLTNAASIIEMGLMQNFLDILLKPQKIRLAKVELERVKTHVEASILDIIWETKRAWWGLSAAQNRLSIKENIFKASELSFDAAQRLKQAGNITRMEMGVEEAFFVELKTQVLSAKNDLVAAREDLQALLGFCDPICWQIEDAPMEIDNCLPDLDCLTFDALQNSLDLKMAWQDMRITALSYGIQIQETIVPEFSLGPDSEKEPEGTWFVGPAFSIGIPLFDFGIAKSAEGRSTLYKLGWEYQALGLEVRKQANKARYRLKTAWENFTQAKDAIIPVNEQNFYETHLQFNAMQLGVIELLKMKQTELNTQLMAIDFFTSYQNAKLDVEKLKSGRMLMREAP